ncbi:MAG: CoA transferase, partial [Actinopolymorphaceae bacterium]
RFVTGVLDRPEWLDDPRFRTLPDRMRHIDDLEGEIEEITASRRTEEWIEALDRAGVPGGPVLGYDEALADPHIRARGMVVDLDHPIIGAMSTIGPPTKFSEFDYSVRSPAPWLGQHTVEVLAEAGLADDEIAALFADSIAFDAHPELQGHRKPAPQQTAATPYDRAGAES